MKTVIRILPVVMIVTTVETSYTQNHSIDFEQSPWEEVLQKARVQNKLIFVDVYTEWCGPCKRMDRVVYGNDSVVSFYNQNFISVKIDAEKLEGKIVAGRYGVNAYPTFLFVTKEGKVAHRDQGFKEPADFVKLGKTAMSSNKNQLSNLSGRFLIGNHLKYVELYGDSVINSKILDAYVADFTAILMHDPLDHKQFFSLRKEIESSGLEIAQKILFIADKDYYLIQGDWESYAKVAMENVEKHYWNNFLALNDVAWDFYEHIDDQKMLEKAAYWAQRSVELLDDAGNNDTYASILYKLGKKDQAIAVERHAIQIYKKAGYSTEELEEKLGLFMK